MSDARYYRAKAEFCFGIAQVLSDPIAAEQTRTLANECVRRAQELETSNGDKSGSKQSHYAALGQKQTSRRQS